jgi:hypothetical protein
MAGREMRAAVCERDGRRAGVDREAIVRGMLVIARRDMVGGVWLLVEGDACGSVKCQS